MSSDAPDNDDGYVALRLRASTVRQLRAALDRLKRRPVSSIPVGLRMDIATLSDVVDMGLRAIDKAVGGVVKS